MKRPVMTPALSLALALMLSTSIDAATTPLSKQLLTNGGGEAGTTELGKDNDVAYYDVPGWDVEQGGWVAQLGTWHNVGAPQGDRHFRPVPSASAKLSQTVKLDLPRGRDRYVVLQALIRNWNSGSDLPSMDLELLDQNNKVLVTKQVGPLKHADWQEHALYAKAPAGTTAARVRLISQRTAGDHNDGYFDDVRLTLAERPPLFVKLKAERIEGTLPPRYRLTNETPGRLTSQRWVFSDGVKMQGRSVERVFDKTGHYGVELSVTDRSGQQGTGKLPSSITITENDLTLRIINGPYLQMPTKEGMTVMWETNAAASSSVILGSGSDQRTIRSAKPVTIHEVRVKGYRPSETVAYHVQSKAGQLSVKSDRSTLTTAPNADKHWRLAVWGDSQDQPHVFGKLVEAMGKAEVDLMLGVGDLVSTGTVYEQWENRLLTPIGPVAKHTPFIAAKGNHEQDATWWYRYMSLPGDERWYATTYGNARIVVLDTNYPFAPGSEQYKWLVRELSSKESKNATWLITAHHHPPFSEIYEENIYKRLREQLWPLYEKHGVDINFHGHVHLFESGEYVPESTGRRIMSVQTSGGGGRLWKDEFDGEWPQIDKVVQWKHHWCQIDFKGDELFFKAIDIDGNLIDEWKLEALPR